jgi:hypothetical protein
MKEIDFLPEWYKSGKRRQTGYRTQYIVLAGIFAVMVVWNFTAVRSISQAKAALAEHTTGRSDLKSASHKFAKIKSQMTKLQKKLEVIQRIDSRIDVASVLGEISFLVNEKIVLSKVWFTAERFTGEAENKKSGGSAVRSAGHNRGKEAMPLGDVRFKVVISGIASDAGDVARLICRLEDSPYFCQVMPSFSQNKEIETRAGAVEKDFQVSEFEIGCYLANYTELATGG